ncbi:hypothetical protein [Streptomyces rapamycinicus]|uniref:Uncharacterized protein n=1 Tax=Streptomyces rapamycinicus TaxID=1226757 RepID=A0ABR6LSH1_9ACTN|nr:hypothetical protein [Streptomyces rapamycinicus]MBB4785276.1 hypothetical protein [Streptomyces rapamycinicus]UTO65478.1 hypothetical protein LJB45_26260 [Streptomyces rapamycinicus]UTP33436.1 hypothetical protein LIV37_31390 [Streptomyces rapamycinicus NRRL 5491]
MDTSRSRTTAQHPQRQDCDLVTVPARQGLEAVDIMRRACDGLGPVLHDNACDTLGFLVPPGTADGWDLPGSACTQTSGRGIRINIDSGTGTGTGTSAEAGDTRTGDSAFGDPPSGDTASGDSASGDSASGDSASGDSESGGSESGDSASGAAGNEAPPGIGTGWLVPPDAAYTVATDPAELRAALGEAARTIEAVDRCQ